jgi:hypothetical protein
MSGPRHCYQFPVSHRGCTPFRTGHMVTLSRTFYARGVDAVESEFGDGRAPSFRRPPAASQCPMCAGSSVYLARERHMMRPSALEIVAGDFALAGGMAVSPSVSWPGPCMQRRLFITRPVQLTCTGPDTSRPAGEECLSLARNGNQQRPHLPLRRVIVGAHCLKLVDSKSRSALAARRCWPDCGP